MEAVQTETQQQMSVISTTELDAQVETLKRSADDLSSASSSEDEHTPVVKKKVKTSGPTYNWGHLYFTSESNNYCIDYNEDTKQFAFVSDQNEKRFCFTIPATKALTKFLRQGGNLGQYAYCKDELSASISTKLIFGTLEKHADLHNEFKTYIQTLEKNLFDKMWENKEIQETMIGKANELLQLPEASTDEEKQANRERLEKVAYKLFMEDAQRGVKENSDGTWELNCRTKAFYEVMKNSKQYRPQTIDYFNGATPGDEGYERLPEDYEMGNVAIISCVLKPKGYTTPGLSNWGISFNLGHEVVVYKELGGASVTVNRDTLLDIDRPYSVITKEGRNGPKVYVKDSNGADFTAIIEGTAEWNIESNLGKFGGKIDKNASKYEGTIDVSPEVKEWIKTVQTSVCDFLLENDDLLQAEKEKMKKTAKMVERPFKDVFHSKFQSPFNQKSGKLKISTKEFYEGPKLDTSGNPMKDENGNIVKEWIRQPFPLEDSEGVACDDEDKIMKGSKIEVPIRFNTYMLSSGVYGMTVSINTKYHTRITEMPGFIAGAAPPPKFDF